MFNSYNATQKIDINAVSGTLVKNYRDSFFLRFGKGSVYERDIFNKNPMLSREVKSTYDGTYYDKECPIVVIQVMILPNEYYLTEIMWKEDFDKLFNIEEAIE